MRLDLVAVSLVVSTSLLAQNRPSGPIDRGSKIVGGTATVLHSDEGSSSTTFISLDPELLFFVAPRVAIGGRLGIFHQKSGSFSQTGWLLGPAARLYFGETTSKTLPFVGLSVLAGSSSAESGSGSSTSTTTTRAFDVSGGVTWMVARQVGFTGEAFFLRTENHFKLAPFDDTFDSSQYGLRAGVSAFLF